MGGSGGLPGAGSSGRALGEDAGAKTVLGQDAGTWGRVLGAKVLGIGCWELNHNTAAGCWSTALDAQPL